MAAVRQYINSFNKGDIAAMGAACDSPMSILDGMAPHVWHGPTASQDWYRDVLKEGAHQGASGYFVELGEPWHVAVTGDRAYVAVPATMAATLKGKRVKQSGSVFGVALRQVGSNWRLRSWAWAKGTQLDVINK
jgi:hypothetical protein